jgi:hypothetical protein
MCEHSLQCALLQSLLLLTYSYGVQLLRASGRTDIPLWYEAGACKFDFADTNTLFVVQLLLMG